MKISTAKAPDLQPVLFEEYNYEARELTLAACRTFAGDFVEEMTRVVTGGVRLKTDSTCDVCPDIQINEQLFIEAKSAGCNNAVVLYECRLKKDLAFVKENGVDLYYFIWNHRYRVDPGATLGCLRDGMAGHLLSLTIISVTELAGVVATQKKRRLNSAIRTRGYGAYGYNDGWQFRLSVLKGLSTPVTTPVEWKDLTAYGRSTPAIPIYGSPSALEMFGFSG